jgi:hypothetical protein
VGRCGVIRTPDRLLMGEPLYQLSYAALEAPSGVAPPAGGFAGRSPPGEVHFEAKQSVSRFLSKRAAGNPYRDSEPHRHPQAMTVLFTCPQVYRGTPTVFLAGGISSCPDWQAEVPALLGEHVNAVLLNPRQASFDVSDPSASRRQVFWEEDHLERADVLFFWFPDSGPVVQPIALLELGRYVAAGNRPAVVGADSGYARRQDVLLQLARTRPDIEVRSTLQAVCVDLRAILGQW